MKESALGSMLVLDNDFVTVECGGQVEHYKTRKDALDLYMRGFYASEGSEALRYARIIVALVEGKDYASDKAEWEDD